MTGLVVMVSIVVVIAVILVSSLSLLLLSLPLSLLLSSPSPSCCFGGVLEWCVAGEVDLAIASLLLSLLLNSPLFPFPTNRFGFGGCGDDGECGTGRGWRAIVRWCRRIGRSCDRRRWCRCVGTEEGMDRSDSGVGGSGFYIVFWRSGRRCSRREEGMLYSVEVVHQFCLFFSNFSALFSH